MAICKDCFHFDVCIDATILNPEHKGVVADKSKECRHFKNKADFEEVIRCKDCKHAKAVMHRGEEMSGIFKCTYLKPNTTMFDIDFCRYGKREEK